MSASIGLVNPKTHANVASALRVADCFGASSLLVRGERYRRHSMDTSAGYSRVPLIQVDNMRAHVPFNHVPVAIEITDDADSLPHFAHPRDALYVFGPEDGTLGREHLAWCRNVIRIPARRCLNLAVCVGIVLYDRVAKFARQEARDANRELAALGGLS